MALNPRRRPIEGERLDALGIEVKDFPCLQQAQHTGLQRSTFTLHKGMGARRVRRMLRRQKQREQRRQALVVHDDPWALPAEIRREHEEAGIPTYQLVVPPLPEDTRRRMQEFIDNELRGSGSFHKILILDGGRGVLMNEDGPRLLPPMQASRFVQIAVDPSMMLPEGRYSSMTEDCKVPGCTWPGVHAHPFDEQGNPDPKRIVEQG